MTQSFEAVSPPAEDFPSARVSRRSVAVLWGVATFTSMDIALTSLLLEPVKIDLSLSDVQLGLLQGTAFGLGMGLSAIPNGFAIDRRRRTGLLRLGMVAWIAAMLAAAFAPGFQILFASEFLLGVLTALLTSAAVSLIGDLVPPARRAHATSIFAVCQSAGQAAAFLAGGLLVQALKANHSPPTGPYDLSPWRLAYVVFAALAVLLLPFVFRLQEPARLEGTRQPKGGMEAIRELSAHRRFLIPLLAAGAFSIMASSAIQTWIAPALSRLYGQDASQIGTYLSAVALPAGIVGSLIAGRLTELSRRLDRGMMMPAALASLASAPCAFLALTPGPAWAVALLGLVIVGVAITGVNVGVALILYIPNELRGLCIGLNLVTSYGVGRALAPSSVALAMQAAGAHATLGLGIAVVAMPSYLLAALLFTVANSGRRRSGTSAQPPKLGATTA